MQINLILRPEIKTFISFYRENPRRNVLSFLGGIENLRLVVSNSRSQLEEMVLTPYTAAILRTRIEDGGIKELVIPDSILPEHLSLAFTRLGLETWDKQNSRLVLNPRKLRVLKERAEGIASRAAQIRGEIQKLFLLEATLSHFKNSILIQAKNLVKLDPELALYNDPRGKNREIFEFLAEKYSKSKDFKIGSDESVIAFLLTNALSGYSEIFDKAKEAVELEKVEEILGVNDFQEAIEVFLEREKKVMGYTIETWAQWFYLRDRRNFSLLLALAIELEKNSSDSEVNDQLKLTIKKNLPQVIEALGLTNNFEAAKRLHPELPYTYNEGVDYLIRQGLLKDNPGILVNEGDRLKSEDKRAEALKNYKKALEILPSEKILRKILTLIDSTPNSEYQVVLDGLEAVLQSDEKLWEEFRSRIANAYQRIGKYFLGDSSLTVSFRRFLVPLACGLDLNNLIVQVVDRHVITNPLLCLEFVLTADPTFRKRIEPSLRRGQREIKEALGLNGTFDPEKKIGESRFTYLEAVEMLASLGIKDFQSVRDERAGDQELEKGNKEEALACYQKALVADPKNLRARAKAAEIEGEFAEIAEEKAEEARRHAEAEEKSRKEKELEEEIQRIAALFSTDDPAQALAQAIEMVKKPETKERAKALLKECYTKVIAVLRKPITLNELNAYPYERYASVLADLGFERKDEKLLCVRAHYACLKGNLNKARNHYHRAMQIPPAALEPYEALAELHLKEKERVKAKALYHQALEKCSLKEEDRKRIEGKLASLEAEEAARIRREMWRKIEFAETGRLGLDLIPEIMEAAGKSSEVQKAPLQERFYRNFAELIISEAVKDSDLNIKLKGLENEYVELVWGIMNVGVNYSQEMEVLFHSPEIFTSAGIQKGLEVLKDDFMIQDAQKYIQIDYDRVDAFLKEVETYPSEAEDYFSLLREKLEEGLLRSIPVVIGILQYFLKCKFNDPVLTKKLGETLEKVCPMVSVKVKKINNQKRLDSVNNHLVDLSYTLRQRGNYSSAISVVTPTKVSSLRARLSIAAAYYQWGEERKDREYLKQSAEEAKAVISQLNKKIHDFKPQTIDFFLVRAYLNLGLVKILEGDYEKAFECFDAAQERDPKQEIAIALIGLIYQHLGKKPEAHFYYQRAMEVDPGRSLIALEIAKECQKIGDKEEAARRINLFFETCTENLKEPTMRKAFKEELEGSFDDELPSLLALADSRYYLQIAEILKEMRPYRVSPQLKKMFLEEEISKASSVFFLAEEREEKVPHLEILEKWRNQKVDSGGEIEDLVKEVIERTSQDPAFRKRAAILLRVKFKGDLEKLVWLMNFLLDFNEDELLLEVAEPIKNLLPIPLHHDLSLAHYQLALQSKDELRGKHLSAVEEIAKDIIKKNPLPYNTESPDAVLLSYNALGLVAIEKAKDENNSQRLEEALEYFTQVEIRFQKHPSRKENLSRVYFNRASALRHLEKPQEAVEYYEKAIEFNPFLFEHYFNLAIIYLQELKDEPDREVKAKAAIDKFFKTNAGRIEQTNLKEILALAYQTEEIHKETMEKVLPWIPEEYRKQVKEAAGIKGGIPRLLSKLWKK